MATPKKGQSKQTKTNKKKFIFWFLSRTLLTHAMIISGIDKHPVQVIENDTEVR